MNPSPRHRPADPVPADAGQSPADAGQSPATVETNRLRHHLDLSADRYSVATEEPGRSSVAADWAASGAMPLTGWADGPPLHPVGRPATIARAAAAVLQRLTGVTVEGPALLGERAALSGFHRQGRISNGGGTRLLRSRDGWWALNLARDADLIPALIEDPALVENSALSEADATEADVERRWTVIQAWAAELSTEDVIRRTTLLGLAAAALGERPPPPAPWRITSRPARRAGRSVPVVVNLGALWAGPLAAHLLGLTGANVVHLESHSRPDPVRVDNPAFYDLLHQGHELRRLKFNAPGELREILSSADIVIEASRPRALHALGADASVIMADGRARTWLRITGHRDPYRIAYGDDAAVAGGLVAGTPDSPVFAGDAIADPLTGLLGAVAVAARHGRGDAVLIQTSLAECAAYCAGTPTVRSELCSPAPHIAAPHIADRRIRPA